MYDRWKNVGVSEELQETRRKRTEAIIAGVLAAGLACCACGWWIWAQRQGEEKNLYTATPTVTLSGREFLPDDLCP